MPVLMVSIPNLRWHLPLSSLTTLTLSILLPCQEERPTGVSCLVVSLIHQPSSYYVWSLMINFQPGANLPCPPPSWRFSPAQPALTPSSCPIPSFRCPHLHPDHCGSNIGDGSEHDVAKFCLGGEWSDFVECMIFLTLVDDHLHFCASAYQPNQRAA